LAILKLYAEEADRPLPCLAVGSDQSTVAFG
jgi:hypothetical protein